MKTDELARLIEQARLRPLSAEEQLRLDALLAKHPDAWPDRDEDDSLSALLSSLPDVDLSTNFTPRVMQSIELEARREQRAPRPFAIHWWAHHWLARLGVASCVAILAIVGWQSHQHRDRARLAESVATISDVTAAPSVEVLRDFEAIQSLGNVPSAADVEADLSLLAALE